MLIEAKVLVGFGCLITLGSIMLFSILTRSKQKANRKIEELVEEQELKRVDAVMKPVRFVLGKDDSINLGEQRLLEKNKTRKE